MEGVPRAELTALHGGLMSDRRSSDGGELQEHGVFRLRIGIGSPDLSQEAPLASAPEASHAGGWTCVNVWA